MIRHLLIGFFFGWLASFIYGWNRRAHYEYKEFKRGYELGQRSRNYHE